MSSDDSSVRDIRPLLTLPLPTPSSSEFLIFIRDLSLRLRPRYPNRVLLYPGSFNPPHKGHLELLSHIFHDARDSLNIVGAIILPVDEQHLYWKRSYLHDAKPLILTKMQRVSLIQNSSFFEEDWTAVWDQPMNEWHSFRRDLERALLVNDITITFSFVGGPDKISVDKLPDPDYWDCREAITSNISRPLDFVREQGPLRRLDGCRDWYRPYCNRDHIKTCVINRLRGQPETTISTVFTLAVAKAETSWACYKYVHPDAKIRFIPGPISSFLSLQLPPSSTTLRDTLASLSSPAPLPIKDLEGVLRDQGALSPTLLIQYADVQKDLLDREKLRKAFDDWDREEAVLVQESVAW